MPKTDEGLILRLAFEVFGTEHIVNATDVLIWLCAFYAVVLIPYYAMRPGFVSDARTVFACAYGWLAKRTRPNFSFDERRAALTLALKLFFGPVMIGFLLTNISEVMQYWRAFASDVAQASIPTRHGDNFWKNAET